MSMVVSLSACKSDNDTSSKQETSSNGDSSIDNSEPAPPISVDDFLNIQYDTSEPENQEMRDMKAFDLVKEMKIGWNLGNSLDAVSQGVDGETAWGNPKVTKELIQAVKAEGFNVIRIPVTWTNYIGEGPDYEIDQKRMDRVHEVVNYVIDEGMYAIINVHHDGQDSSTSWLTPAVKDDAHKAEMLAKYQKVWEQIAERFKNYPDYLVFESMNEFHKGYNNPLKSYTELTNEINQLFVDIVRNSGGNNDKRHLLLPGYNTNIDHTISGFVMPKDTIENRIIVSVHNYDPWLTALEGKFPQWGKFATDKTQVDTWGQEDYIVELYEKLKTAYTDKGIPVILGEFGASYGLKEPYRTYYTEFIVQQAAKNDVLPILWDNGSLGMSSKETFGFFDRYNATPVNPVFFQALREATSGKDYEVVLREQQDSD